MSESGGESPGALYSSRFQRKGDGARCRFRTCDPYRVKVLVFSVGLMQLPHCCQFSAHSSPRLLDQNANTVKIGGGVFGGPSGAGLVMQRRRSVSDLVIVLSARLADSFIVHPAKRIQFFAVSASGKMFRVIENASDLRCDLFFRHCATNSCDPRLSRSWK